MRKSLVRKLCDECDALCVIFEQKPAEKPEEEIEKRDKIVVTSILPFLLINTSLLVKAALFLLGLLVSLLLKSG